MAGLGSTMRLALVIVLLVVFLALGVAHVINPDYFIARSGVRKGGELLTGWNRLGFRAAGAAFAVLAIYLLLEVFRR